MRFSLIYLIGIVFLICSISVIAISEENNTSIEQGDSGGNLYTLQNYVTCLMNKEKCVNEYVFRQAHTFLYLFTLLALIIFFSKEKRLEQIFKKTRKKMDYFNR